MNSRRLFLASCLALIATAMAFSIRADIIPALKTDFGFTDTQMGEIAGPGLWGFAITIVLGGMLVDMLGMKALMWLAFTGHVTGVLLTIFAQGYGSLYFATLLIGLANGTVEAVVNPLAASLYPESKSKHLNRLHAWWPGGLILGGLACYALTETLHVDWRWKMALILLPTSLYGYLIYGQFFPETERVTSGVSYREMWGEVKRPLFIVFMGLMMLTAATELGPDQWIGSMLQNLVGIQGVLLLVYTAGIMFILRQFLAGSLLTSLSPLGLLTLSSVLAALGLYGLSGATTARDVVVAATVFGVGKTFFWPTMIGVVAERFPKGGALLMGLVGGAGMFCVGWVMTPVMGSLQDLYTLEALPSTLHAEVMTDGKLDQRKLMALESRPEAKEAVATAHHYSASMTYRRVSLVPVFLTFVFSFLYFYFRRLGGYRAVRLQPTVSL